MSRIPRPPPPAGQPGPPQSPKIPDSIAAMRECRGVPEPGRSLWERLGAATIDPYRRSSKASRDYPRKKREQAIGSPEIRPATRLEIERAEQIKHEQQKRLTA